ncbi:MAG: TonB-dependent receptor [Deltaproteobacteria bacterium]|nr:TonB-dependent receptor [Deltaproteobacteria bacterium]
MKKSFFVAVAALTLLLLTAPAAVKAVVADPDEPIAQIIVTASRIEEPLKYSPDAVTVVTETEMKQKGQKTVIDVLEDTPGMVVSRNGAFGAPSSIYLRGTNNAHTFIMIDGVRVGDSMSTDGKLSISDLSTDNIERIEIVRGAQSVLYGSDAIGGVINIITKKGKGKPSFSFSSEAGSFQSFRENVGVSGSNDRLSYAASVERFDTQGVSKADEDLPGIDEEDYYHNTSISARLSGRLSDTTSMGFTVRHNESELDMDGYDYVTYAITDTDEVQEITLTSTSANFDHDLTDWWQHMIKIGNTDVERKYTLNGKFNNAFSGTNRQTSWQHNFFIGTVDTISAGFDYEEEEGDLQDPTYGNIPNKSTNTKSFFLQNKLTAFKGISVTLGYRAIDHQTFGSEDLFKAAAAYLIEKTGTKIRGSYGTGFHAPCLYQLYSSYGDPTLKPEKSKSYDIGIEQFFLDEKGNVSLTYFHNEIEDLIDWHPITYVTYNVGEAKTEGWEAVFSFSPANRISFDAAYTYTKATDETPGGIYTGKALRYRPKHSGSASVNIKPQEKLNVNVNARYTGKRYRDKSNINTMPDYTLLNLSASYDVTQRFRVFGRIDNLTDENYNSMYEYGEPGIGFYGGVTLTF